MCLLCASCRILFTVCSVVEEQRVIFPSLIQFFMVGRFMQRTLFQAMDGYSVMGYPFILPLII